MAENTNTTTTFANDTPTEFILQTLLDRAEEDWVFPRYGTQVKLPAHQGNTIQFVRYERLGLPGAPLSEGATGDGQTMSPAKVTASVDQWGSYITESDVAILQTFHEIIEEGSKLLGEQWARINDREIQRTLMRGTNVRWAGSATAATNLATTDVPTTNDIYGALERLRARGARPFSGDAFICIVDTANEIDMLKDPTFVATKAQISAVPLERGEFMDWAGCKFVRSNQIPSFVATATAMDATSLAADADATNALADSTEHFLLFVGVDEDGQEVVIQDAAQSVTTGTNETIEWLNAAASAVPAGVTAINIYAGLTAAGATLQLRNATLGAQYTLSGTGSTDVTGSTGIAFTDTGVAVPPIPTAGVTLHTMFFIGRGYYAVIDNGPMTTHKTNLTTSGESTDSDPLNQRFKFGYKGIRKDAILNENFGLRLHCASSQTGYYYA